VRHGAFPMTIFNGVILDHAEWLFHFGEDVDVFGTMRLTMVQGDKSNHLFNKK